MRSAPKPRREKEFGIDQFALFPRSEKTGEHEEVRVGSIDLNPEFTWTDQKQERFLDLLGQDRRGKDRTEESAFQNSLIKAILADQLFLKTESGKKERVNPARFMKHFLAQMPDKKTPTGGTFAQEAKLYLIGIEAAARAIEYFQTDFVRKKHQQVGELELHQVIGTSNVLDAQRETDAVVLRYTIEDSELHIKEMILVQAKAGDASAQFDQIYETHQKFVNELASVETQLKLRDQFRQQEFVESGALFGEAFKEASAPERLLLLGGMFDEPLFELFSEIDKGNALTDEDVTSFFDSDSLVAVKLFFAHYASYGGGRRSPVVDYLRLVARSYDLDEQVAVAAGEQLFLWAQRTLTSNERESLLPPREVLPLVVPRVVSSVVHGFNRNPSGRSHNKELSLSQPIALVTIDKN